MAIDMSAAKAPPQKRATAKKAATPVVSDTPSLSLTHQRYEGLLGLASLAQGVCLMVGWHADAMTIQRGFPPVALEVAKIADDNEAVSQPLDFLIKVGPYGALLAALLPFGMQIAANHKWIDASKAMGQGIVPPEVLEAQMKAEMARMQAEAMKQQQMALQQANEAAEEYAKMMAEYESAGKTSVD